MRFSLSNAWHPLPAGIRVGIVALLWLALITGLHFWLNTESVQRRVIRMGYMPVITNLASPLLDAASREGDGIRFKAIKFASFSEMAEALRNDQIQAAFMIAPLSIVLHQQHEDIRVVYIGNRHESTLVVRKDLHATRLADLRGRTLAVPMRYSGHNLCILQMLEQQGLTGQVNIVEMNPPDMPAALATGALDAYFVGEPFAAQSLMDGSASLLYYVEDVWKYFICNLMVMKQGFIESQPDVVAALVSGAVRSGLWAEKHPSEAAAVVSEYWNQPPALASYALTTPEHRIVFDHYTPRREELQHMADLMLKFGLTTSSDIGDLVDDRFARSAPVSGITDLGSILAAPSSGGDGRRSPVPDHTREVGENRPIIPQPRYLAAGRSRSDRNSSTTDSSSGN